MDINKLTTQEIMSLTKPKMMEVATDIRKEIVKMKMEGIMAAAPNSGKIRRLRKNLARVLTYYNANK